MDTFSSITRSRLRRLIADNGHSIRSLERSMERGNRWLGRKLAGKKRLYLTDIDAILEHLEEPPGALD